jgi:hypothetical protein
MTLLVGEFGTFMSQYDDDLMAILTDFYNVHSYGQRRRGGQLKIKIERPSLSLLIGTTPANLMKFMPENAWGQGFASRILFIYAEDKNIVDDFSSDKPILDPDLVHDIKLINSVGGQFSVSDDYSKLVLAWREAGEQFDEYPKPTHPRLKHYCSRRKEHLYRLSMISSVNRGSSLILDRADFNQAMSWLVEAEAFMPQIFAQESSGDTAIMEEVYHQICHKGRLPESMVVRAISRKAPAHAVMRIVDVMIQTGLLKILSTDRYGMRQFGPGVNPNISA